MKNQHTFLQTPLHMVGIDRLDCIYGMYWFQLNKSIKRWRRDYANNAYLCKQYVNAYSFILILNASKLLHAFAPLLTFHLPSSYCWLLFSNDRCNGSKIPSMAGFRCFTWTSMMFVCSLVSRTILIIVVKWFVISYFELEDWMNIWQHWLVIN